MKRKDNRGSLYLVTALVLGVSAGLIYGWLVWPVSYVNTIPEALRSDFKDRYRVLIAQVFLSNQDIGRASARLGLLGDMDSVVALTLQAQRAIAEGRPESEIQALTYLMLALSQSDDGPLQLPTPITPIGIPTVVFTGTATATSIPVFTATPVIHSGTEPTTGTITAPTMSALPATSTPTAVTGISFALSEKTLVCDPLQEAPRLQIETQDAKGKPIPGVAITIRRKDQGGEEHFFTGLKPEISLGYADFTMLPEVNYMLWLGEGGQPVEIEPPQCPNGSANAWGTWKLLFIQP